MSSAPYIDIHTHRSGQSDSGTIQISNVIVGKDYMLTSWCSVGIHPWYIHTDPADQVKALQSYTGKNNVLAIGECGLDKLHNSGQWEKQLSIFQMQIELANQLDRPIIIHCVRAYQEVLDVLKRHVIQVPVIFHGYSKNHELARQILNYGYFISLGHQVLKGKQDDVISNIPLDHIFFETDDKAISIADIYTYFCRVRKIELMPLKEQIVFNFKAIFNATYITE